MKKTYSQLVGYLVCIIATQECQCPKKSYPQQTKPISNNRTANKAADSHPTIAASVIQPTQQIIESYDDPGVATFFRQTIDAINAGDTNAVNRQNPDDHNATVLEYALETDNERLFDALLACQPDLTQKNRFGTLLHMAIDLGKINFVQRLLGQPQVDAFINLLDNKNRSPLALAQRMSTKNTHPRKAPIWRFIIQQLQEKRGN